MAAAEAALGTEAARDATRGDEGAAETARLTEGSMATATGGASMRRGGGSGRNREGGPLGEGGVRGRETAGPVVEVGSRWGGVFCVRGWRAVCQCQRAPGRRWKGFRRGAALIA